MTSLAIRVARVFDGERLLDGVSVVLVKDGRIAGVEAGPAVPGGWPVRDLPDGTLLPGLIDAHVHLCADGGPGALDRLAGRTEEQTDATIEASLRAHLAAGVTTVRDLGDHRDAVPAWRSRGGPGLPAVVAAGAPITSVGGHCGSMGGEARGADGLREAVRLRAERGADIVKIMASGGVLTPGTDTMSPQFTDDELRAAVAEAHALGLPITAHAHALAAVRQALDAGVDGIEHCTCLTPDGVRLDDALLAALAGSQVAVCATLGSDPGVVVPPQVVAMAERAGITEAVLQEAVARLHRGGVRLVAGSDGGIGPAKPHGLLPATLGEYVRSGLPETSALAAATSAAAGACGVGDRKGRIRTGHDADLLVVDGDPTRDIAALGRPLAVYLAGRPATG
ncbi:amidohydrolase family protein [Planomonospora sp. ID91781]|uniref:amidohydrolase family protein n=1 Tax=Planomonospora sp. ID91781 TaxID=2738135 RepID=UPI0018C3FEF2|nr:amidohydrolase family protein [Planomonospora sp. ID91781]MBG0823003.1 amidohydrolase family protein [Planomonospora sp. ID91781]